MDESTFSETSSGETLHVYEWAPRREPKALVLIAHGYGEHAGRYQHVGQRLADEGYLVVAPDHHGHGQSTGRRGFASPDVAARDLDALREHTLAEHPGLAAFALGHSMGGGIVLYWALRNRAEKEPTLKGIVLSSPLLALDLSGAQKKLLLVLPKKMATQKIDPKLVSRDPAVVSAYETDPLVWHKGIPADQILTWQAMCASFGPRVDGFALPTLLMWGSEDKLCLPEHAAEQATYFEKHRLSTRVWPGLFHELFHEPEQDQVLDETVSWLDSQL